MDKQYPYYLANKAQQPNADLEVRDKYSGRIATRVAEMLAGGIDLMVEVPPTSLGQFEGEQFQVYEQAGPHRGS